MNSAHRTSAWCVFTHHAEMSKISPWSDKSEERGGGWGGGKRGGYKIKNSKRKVKRIASVKKITWNIQILYCMYVFISFHIHLYPVLDRTAYRIHIQYTGHRHLALNI